MVTILKWVGVLALFAVGAGLGYGAYYQFGTDLLRERWESTSGEATSYFVGQTQVAAAEGGERTVYFPEVAYVYRVGGATYAGSRVAAYRPAFDDEAQAQAQLDALVQDWWVTVYYDPTDPSRAMLDTSFDKRPMWAMAGAAAFCFILGAVLAFAFLAMRQKGGRRRATAGTRHVAASFDGSGEDNRVPVHDYMASRAGAASRGGKPIGPKRSVVTGALILAAAGVVIGYFGWQDTAAATGDAGWEQVSGRLEQSSVAEVETYRKYRGRVLEYRPQVRYSYTVDGSAYTSDDIVRGAAYYSTREEAQARLSELTRGGTVQVYYRASQPEKGYLDVEHYESAVYGQVFMGVSMILIGFGIIFWRLVIMRHIP